MSGLLRRIKRSRTAGAGEPPADEQAAAPGGASTTPETAPADDAVKSTKLPVTQPPAIAADPDQPAGLDERVAAASRPPAGRRASLRRRLRYLRRARELMLRDLGGLVYEVHRSGGGDFGAHRAVVDGKIERLVVLDAESGAIENALGAARAEAALFEPGIGGICDVCGELYGSAARFCSHCGTATDPAARETPAPTAEPRPVPPMPKAPGQAAAEEPAAKTGATAPLKPVGDAKDETAPLEPVEEPGAGDEPKTAELKPDDAAGDPFENASNGRPEEKQDESQADPLTARESRK